MAYSYPNAVPAVRVDFYPNFAMHRKWLPTMAVKSVQYHVVNVAVCLKVLAKHILYGNACAKVYVECVVLHVVVCMCSNACVPIALTMHRRRLEIYCVDHIQKAHPKTYPNNNIQTHCAKKK